MSAATAVFIPTNPKQLVAARVAAHALTRHGSPEDPIEVHVIVTTDFPVLARREGEWLLRNGVREAWRNDDLQSFTPLRFAVPSLMGYAGRALVIDPDVFAVRDVRPLLTRDLGGAAIGARPLHEPGEPVRFASSVMLLDCGRLRHWNLEKDFGELFSGERDYRAWMQLELEASAGIAPLEPEWNDFDHLSAQTGLLHNTRRVTQPWKTGLPVDFVVHRKGPERSWLQRFWRRVRGKPDGRTPSTYRRHPDPAQEQLFFALLAECVEKNLVTVPMLEQAIARQELRRDALQLLESARSRTSTPRMASA
ncbi:hypothetical protein DFR24_1253 [Panacagrimonas perspica]|uniref:Glycosyl transferase family 8 n=1 Tax=Panacagrimonas perspica TaxID=381431 RepID=A0A4R7PE10_9GAMM|nr:hypothetical protein [Panacagrimonas perspica]TDU31869.1 hypothetical protein DFR24_1253 [Panacagrimonas perspica]THD02933.1 hypothetical protein B1810_09975 [Panacagrimonas perspica]